MKELFWGVVVAIGVWLIIMLLLVVTGVSIVLAYHISSAILGGLH